MPSTSIHARAPKQGRSRQSFERIIEATTALLRERAYDQITLADICQRAEVSTGALYGRVAGKDELLRAVQVRFLENIDNQFTDEAAHIAGSAHGLAEVVPAVVAGLGKLLKENASVLRAFMLRAPYDEAIATEGGRSALRNHDKFIQLLRSCGNEILHPIPERAINSSMELIYATQARFLGLDSAEGMRGDSGWQDLLIDLSDMVLAFLLFVPKRKDPANSSV